MTHHLLLYLLAVLMVNLLPGPDMLYVISQSLSQGKRFGLCAALGIGAGCFVHIFAVTVGLSSFIFESSRAFTMIKYIGASYLIYIGLSSIMKKQSLLLGENNSSLVSSAKKAFTQGFITNVLNPKVALFFLAFLPQFVMPSLNYSIGFQMLVLGCIFNFSGTLLNSLVAIFFGTVKNYLGTHPSILTLQQKMTGLVLVGLGLQLAVFERKSG